MYNPNRYFVAATLAGFLFLGAAQSSFGQISFTNGKFTSFSATASTDTGIGGGLTDTGPTTYTGDTLTGWNNQGYTFVYRSPNVGDETITGSGGAFSLWGQSNGGASTLVLPPGGGNFIVDDGAYEVGPVTQVITGLTSGTKYVVGFEWAAAQQSGYNSATTESWSVGLGNASDITYTEGTNDTSGTLVGTGATPTNSVNKTATYDNPTKSFSGWMTQTFTFTANATSDTLYFFANGTPTGEPPFLLLADVNVVVPEPKTSACWVILFAMLILVGKRFWHRWQKSPSANA